MQIAKRNMRSARRSEFRTSHFAVRAFCFSAFLVGVTAAVLRADVSWTEIRTLHFTVITNADASDGRRVAEQFERFRAVFERLTEQRIRTLERRVDVLVLGGGPSPCPEARCPMTTKIRRSSENVFRDVGFSAEEATNLELRSDFIRQR